MFSARFGVTQTPSIVPITAVNGPYADGAVVVGTVLTHQLVITGGTGPFAVKLRNQSGTLIQTNTGFVNGSNISYTTTGNDGAGIYLVITDSLAQTFGSTYWITYDPIWITSVNLTANTYTPAVGAIVTLTANPAASTTGSRTYTWYYRQKPNGGTYSTSFAIFATGSTTTQATGTCAAGITYQFYVNLTNPAGTVSSNSVECVTT